MTHTAPAVNLHAVTAIAREQLSTATVDGLAMAMAYALVSHFAYGPATPALEAKDPFQARLNKAARIARERTFTPKQLTPASRTRREITAGEKLARVLLHNARVVLEHSSNNVS